MRPRTASQGGNKMNRRSFLTLLGSASIAGLAGEASAATFKGHDGFGVLHDMTLCIGCRKCEQACAT